MQVDLKKDMEPVLRLHRTLASGGMAPGRFEVNISEPPTELFFDFPDGTYVISIKELTGVVIDEREKMMKKEKEKKEEGRGVTDG